MVGNVPEIGGNVKGAIDIRRFDYNPVVKQLIGKVIALSYFQSFMMLIRD